MELTELTELADELYALAPDEFTKARNERAKALRAEDKELAARLGKLPKPSTAAWVVNMLARYQAEQLTRVLDLGAAMRQAQQSLDGDELRELSRQRRQLTYAVSTEARRLARDLGVRVSDAVTAQVEETLRAAMTDEGAAQAVRTGQLVEALTATGIEDLDLTQAIAVPEAIGISARPVEKSTAADEEHGEQKPQLQVVPDAEADSRAVEEAERALKGAEDAAQAADKKLAKARRRVAKLEARSLELAGQLEEVRRRAGELEHELERVDDELGSAEDKRDRAEESQGEAVATLEKARMERERLRG